MGRVRANTVLISASFPPTNGARRLDPLTDVRSRSVRLAFTALAVGVAYYVGAKVGFALTPKLQPVSTLWPPNAILLGALLLAPVRWWPVVLLAAFPAHLAVELRSGVPLSMVLSWFVSNCTEALIGAAGVRWFIKRPVEFDSFRRVGIFVVWAALIAPFASSFLDAAFVTWNGWGNASYWEVWRVRFFSNILAILTLVPAIVTWGNSGIAALRSISPRRALEASALAAGLLVVCTVVFTRPALGVHVTPALLYAPLPFLLWAAVRFGPAGASASLLIFAVLSVWGAIHGQGPFVGHTIAENVLSLQLFLIVTYIPLMALTAVIRERSRAEEKALVNEERLNVALGAAQVGAWDWDIVGDRATLSSTTKEMLGLPETNGEVDQRTFLDAVTPDDQPIVREAIEDAIGHAKPYEVEFRTTARNGAVRWMLAKGTVVRDTTGRPIRMVGINADITERKLGEEALRGEAALRESEAKLRALADAMPQIVFTARPDGSIDYLNRKWYEMTGTVPDTIEEDTWFNVIHPHERIGCAETWRDNVRAGRPHEHEARFWSAVAGTYLWHLVRALPVRDETGAIVHWYGTATDIDDRKRAEHDLQRSESSLRVLRAELEFRVAERTLALSRTNATLREEIDIRTRVERALRSSEERFAKAFRASLDAVSIARQPQATILEINDRWEAMFGYSRDDAIGKTIDQLRIFAHDATCERFFSVMQAQGYVSEFELDMRHKDGAILRAVLAAETVDVGGEPCLITMVRDITERQRAEHEIAVQRNELAHLGRVALLGELSGALAHELNQPLAAILANARAAQRMLIRDPVNVPELRAILDDIVSDDRRAGAVIRNVRALIRKDDTDLQPVAANEVVTDVLELAHSDLIQRAVSVSTELAPSLPAVHADRIHLQQVMLNLIVNACDAMADNPPNDRCLVITTGTSGKAVCVSVIDNGTGISTEPIDRVFEPFVTSKRHGLGLGLAICRSIMDAHGGRMWAVNNTHRGATFYVMLPLAPIPADVPVAELALTTK